jgi:hypothetical protein
MAEARFDPPKAPVTVVAHVARDASEAQVLAANLNAAGIPAYVENAALVDHYAMSQKLMNRMGVRVHVMSDRVEEAREFIADRPQISDDELEAQALAAVPEDEPPLATAHPFMDWMRRRFWRNTILLFPGLLGPLAIILLILLGKLFLG